MTTYTIIQKSYTIIIKKLIFKTSKW